MKKSMKKSVVSSQWSVAGAGAHPKTTDHGLLTADSPPPTTDCLRPFVLINMAMTADGKIASANRAVTTFGSRRDLDHLYELRATVDAVMAGARTIEETNAELGPGGARFRRLRLKNGLAGFSLRVIVSGSGSIDTSAAIFRKHFAPLLVITTARAPARKLGRLRALADEVLVCDEREIDFVTALRHLRRKWKVKRLLCEGGGELNDALFRAGLVDELHLTVCPRIFGGAHAPTIADGTGARRLAEAANFRLISSQRVGDEFFLVLRASSSRAARGSTLLTTCGATR
jgi:2,5-diamino-6-(ribosylamino)-4(3H)-pyrimidinone 5'-phosphate reductase